MPRPAVEPTAHDVPARHQEAAVRGETAAPPTGAPAGAGSPGAAAAAPAAPLSKRALTPRRVATRKPADKDAPDVSGEVAEALKDAIKDGREVTAGEYIQALHDAGIYEGIGAFNPPGTSPPLEGLVVPPDYELPEGYVRHFQSTDDGQPIDPILMYSPDYEFFDANGNPVPIPENRVVPPEQAPPGFPIQPVEIPGKRPPGDTAR
jgi:hypothetical protein